MCGSRKAATTLRANARRVTYRRELGRLGMRMDTVTEYKPAAWLDQHDGLAYVYGMKYRPAQCGFTCPREGYLLRLESDPVSKHPDYRHGLVFYSRALTDAEVTAYELAPVGTYKRK